MSLSTYTREKLKMLGNANIRVDRDSRRVTLPVIVVQGEGTLMAALMGRNRLAKWKIGCMTIYSLIADQLVEKSENVRKNYTGAFRSTPGMVRNFEARIIIRNGVQPVFGKAGPIPFAMKNKVDKELNGLKKSE